MCPYMSVCVCVCQRVSECVTIIAVTFASTAHPRRQCQQSEDHSVRSCLTPATGKSIHAVI